MCSLYGWKIDETVVRSVVLVLDKASITGSLRFGRSEVLWSLASIGWNCPLTRNTSLLCGSEIYIT